MARKKNGSVMRKYIFDLFKGHKKKLTIIMLVALVSSGLEAAIPMIYGKIFDVAVIPNTTTNFLLSLIGVWLVLSLISEYSEIKAGYLGGHLADKVTLKNESELYNHFLKLPISFHKDKKTGSILKMINIKSYKMMKLISTISFTLPAILFVIFATIVMFFVNWQIASIIVFSLMVYAFATFNLSKPISKSNEKMDKASEKAYGKTYDRLYNVFLIKNFGKEELQSKNISKSLMGTLPFKIEWRKKYARLDFSQGVIRNAGFVIALAVAMLFLRSGQMTHGEVIMFFGYVGLLFRPIRVLEDVYRDYKEISVSIKRIITMKRLVPEEMKHGDKVIKDFKGEIGFDGLSFGYNKGKQTLRDISFNIEAGESIALVGESGMGKTTLAELVMGYYKPSKGKIFFDSEDISNLKLQWIRDQIAIVPQETSVFNETLISNLRHAKPKASFDEIVSAAKLSNAHDFIMELPKGYNTLVGERGVKLSGGQKQRVAITMAFLKDPKILILDEPTSALDAKAEKSVQEGMKHLMEGRTTIIIAHRFSTVRDVDRIFVLEKGKIIERGNHKELMKKKGKYYGLYRLQRGLD